MGQTFRRAKIMTFRTEDQVRNQAGITLGFIDLNSFLKFPCEGES